MADFQDSDDDNDGVDDTDDDCPLGTVGRGGLPRSVDIDGDGCDDSFEDEDVGNDGLIDADQDQQNIFLEPRRIVIDRFKNVELVYSTDPVTANSAGIGIKLFYDSSQIDIRAKEVPSAVSSYLLSSGPQVDFLNLDSDPNTDSYFAIAFVDFGGNFPGPDAWNGDVVKLAELLIEYVGEGAEFTNTYLVADPAAGFASKGLLTAIALGIETNDSDDDGFLNDVDKFPLDPLEWIDTDSDGIGNNSDPDDDNDGFTDEEELVDGTDPLSRFSCRSGCFSFDIDRNGEAKALTDGLLVIRHLFGFTGDALADGAISSDATRDRAEDISALLADADSELDIDGNGESKALSDGLLLIRYLFGFSGDALTVGAIGEGATRDTSEAIEAYISERVPNSE